MPPDTPAVASLVRWATTEQRVLIPRGAGSGMPGGNVGRGVIADLSLGLRQLEVDPRARHARTGASVTWAQLTEAARTHGLRLPPDPSSGPFATVGGMASTNAAGPRTLRYGSVREWIEAIELVGGDGEIRTIRRGAGSGERFAPKQDDLRRAVAGFPKTRKNSSGYALDAFAESGDEIDLFIGAEGTLGIITAVEWRLDPIPTDVAGLALGLGDLAALGEAVPYLVALNPSAVELLDRTLLSFIEQGGGETIVPAGLDCLLLVEFERETSAAARGVVGDAVRGLKHLTRWVETAVDRAGLAQLWEVRRLASPALARLPDTRRSLQVIEDGCVPLERLGEYVAGLREAATRREIPVAMFGHAGDGHVHVNALPDLSRSGWRDALTGLFADVRELLRRCGGTASGEHGDGRLRAGLLEPLFGPAAIALFRAVKRAYDPESVFNPGVILPAADWTPLADLKVGPAAAPIPDDIAARLRDLERQGGWATPKPELAR